MRKVTKIDKPSKEATIGKRIKYARRKNGLSQNKLGEMVGRSANEITYYETEKRNPDIYTLKSIAEKLQVSTDYLLGITEFENIGDDYKIVNKITGFENEVISILEEINSLYEGQYLIPILNFLIKQEKLPPNEAIFEERYTKADMSNATEKRKEEYKEKVYDIYQRVLQEWKNKDYRPILSEIEEYYTLKIDGELYITNNSVKRKQDFSSKIDEQIMTRKIIAKEKIVENTYLEEIKIKLRELKKKYVEGEDKN